VKVYYDPQDPQQARLGVFSELWLWQSVFLGMGLLFIAIGITVWWFLRRPSAPGPVAQLITARRRGSPFSTPSQDSPFDAQELADMAAAESANAAPAPLDSADELQPRDDEPANSAGA
jgi:hypothetical protein